MVQKLIVLVLSFTFVLGCAAKQTPVSEDVQKMIPALLNDIAAVNAKKPAQKDGVVPADLKALLDSNYSELKQTLAKASPLATDKIFHAKDEQDDKNKNTTWAAGVTTGLAAITAIVDEAVAGGIVTAIAGIWTFVSQKDKEQADKNKESVYKECNPLIGEEGAKVENYHNRWSLKLKGLAESKPVEAPVVQDFTKETDDLWNRIKTEITECTKA